MQVFCNHGKELTMTFKKHLSLVIVLAAMVLFPSLDSFAGFIDGNKLVQNMDAWEKYQRRDPNAIPVDGALYVGYVTGVYDSLESLFDNPGNVTIPQICSIVAKYLQENPEKWNLSASLLIKDALQKAFPKR
jgi:hypothetical protein